MSIFTKFFSWIKGLLGRGKQVTESILHVAIGITDALKNIVDSPVSDIIVAITPTNLDNVLLSKFRAALPKVLQNMTIAQKYLELNDEEAILKAIVAELKSELITDEAWSKFFTEFSGMLTYFFSDGEFTVGEAFSAAQYVYYNLPKK